ncbi:MAG: L,D-transpeptidase family protein [Verrucomicrobiota bacterium]
MTPLVVVALALLTAGCVAVREQPPPARVGDLRPAPQGRAVSRPAAPPRPVPAAYEPRAVPTNSFRDVVAIQTLLDRANMSCGCIDGVLGPKTRLALRTWQQVNGLPPTGEPDEGTRQRLGPLAGVFTTHVVGVDEGASLTPVPATWVGKSRVQRLGYETILETVAEKYHASQQAIRELNRNLSWPNPPAGTELVVPNPEPFELRPAARMTISLGQKLFRVYDAGGRLLALFPCSIARDKAKRPIGELSVVNCASNPNFTFDPAVFTDDPESASIRNKLVIPPGPNNPVGVAWISLSLLGYGMHGTPHPEDIGKTESHGCFRLANWNAEKLLKMIAIGIPVTIEP